ncbi:hypothetical protein D9M72_551090 [compost metagenome]
MRMAADHLARHRFDDVAKGKVAGFLRHPGMEHHLQQQIAEFVAEVVHVAALDGIGNLIGFLDRVGFDRLEGLDDVPGATGFRLPERGHDIEQAFYIA